MSHVTQHIIPQILTQGLCHDCMSTCGDQINSADKDWMFLNPIIIGDKIWCFLYDMQLKPKSATWKFPPGKKKV
jgi:hypothetical protein